MDGILIHGGQPGSEEAFAALFEQYKNLVFQTAYLMLDDSHQAEDVLQDVFIRVHQSMDSYDPKKGAFGTWLHRITINQCLNWRRRKSYNSPSLEDIPENQLLGPAVSEEALAESQVIRQALAKLSQKQRSIVILRYYWEYSYAEMAEILNLPLGTIKSRLNLALQTLQLDLGREKQAESSSISEGVQ